MTLGETSSLHAEKYASKYASVITLKKMNNIITQPPLSAERANAGAHTLRSKCNHHHGKQRHRTNPDNNCQCDRTVVLSHETRLAHRSRPAIWAQDLRSGKMSFRERWG
jgi:hypothetical protein